MIDTTKAKADAEEGLRIAEKATEGPWNKADCVSPKIVIYAVPQGPHGFGDTKTLYLGETYCDQVGQGRANLTFIADSRTRAPAAYRNVIALAEENETLRDALQKVGDEREIFIRAHDEMTKHACELEAERDEARAWVRQMTELTRVLTCAFCGGAYPPGTPDSNHDALTAHVLICAKHPMRTIEAERDVLIAERNENERRWTEIRRDIEAEQEGLRAEVARLAPLDDAVRRQRERDEAIEQGSR